MGLLNFIRRKLGLHWNTSVVEGMRYNDSKQNVTKEKKLNLDFNEGTDREFEFLITGELDVFDGFDNIMTPNTLKWIKVAKDGWNFYQVEKDEYSYSIEPPGIQMVFNKEITFAKAKQIVDEIIQNINATGQHAELVIIDKAKIYNSN